MVAPPIFADGPPNRQARRRASRPQQSHGGPHAVFTDGPPVHVTAKARMHFMGYVHRSKAPWLDCDSPVLLSVPGGGVNHVRCKSPSQTFCKPCAGRFRRLVRRAVADGIRLKAGEVGWFTLTPPSEIGTHCYVEGCAGLTCSHEKCPCTPEGGIDLGEWNATLGKRFSNFLRSWERWYGERPQYSKAVETQKRGGLHLHVPYRSGVHITEAVVKHLAMANGFGHEVDVQVVDPGDAGAVARLAVYVSKYVSKAVDDRKEVPWADDYTDPWTGEARKIDGPARYRTFSQSRQWGPSMRELRRLARVRYLVQLEGVTLVPVDAPGPGAECGPADAPAPDD